ncbi:MAG: ferredoxin [Patescibacteria group bacterium]|nr:ferredoxin [Patescibacteria group bacterium]
MAKFKIKHDRDNCIGCGACTMVCGQFWSIGDDGKADLKDAVNNELEIDEEDLDCNKQAAESCPVAVIHVED